MLFRAVAGFGPDGHRRIAHHVGDNAVVGTDGFEQGLVIVIHQGMQVIRRELFGEGGVLLGVGSHDDTVHLLASPGDMLHALGDLINDIDRQVITKGLADIAPLPLHIAIQQEKTQHRRQRQLQQQRCGQG